MKRAHSRAFPSLYSPLQSKRSLRVIIFGVCFALLLSSVSSLWSTTATAKNYTPVKKTRAQQNGSPNRRARRVAPPQARSARPQQICPIWTKSVAPLKARETTRRALKPRRQFLPLRVRAESLMNFRRVSRFLAPGGLTGDRIMRSRGLRKRPVLRRNLCSGPTKRPHKLCFSN